MPSSSSPLSLRSLSWQDLPSKPGIYIYKDAHAKLLYVGKAKSLRDRVRSYFQPTQSLGTKTAALVSQIASIEYVEVGSEIEALLLESSLIKKHKPPYNIASKDDKSPYYIHFTKEELPRPEVNHDPKNALAGPFLNGYTARQILKQFRRIAPYCSANRPVKRPCLYSHLGLCAPCPGAADFSPGEYKQNLARLRRLLSGNFKPVMSQLQKDMLLAAKAEEFEAAAKLRNQLERLHYLLQQPVLPEEYLANPNLIQDKRQATLESLCAALEPYLKFPSPSLRRGAGVRLARIEMYDIANISGTSATAAMTVAQDGEPDSRLYRHFTIKSKATPDDPGMLREVLTRRLARTDWPVPDLIVLDGGKSQLSIVADLKIPLSLAKERGWGEVPIISLAKREETIIIPKLNDKWQLENDKFIELKLPLDHPGLQLLQRLRDEAHRFSRRLHHKHRAKQLLT